MTYTTTEYKLCKPQKKPLLTKTNDHILKQQTKINDICTKKKRRYSGGWLPITLN